MLSVTIGGLQTNDMPTSKDELIAVPVTNSGSDPVTVTVQSSNSNVTAEVISGGRSLTLNVKGRDANGVDFTGNLTFRLFENADPVTTGRIIQLAQQGFYNNLLFHRVIQDFVAQGGDPSGDGTGGSGVKFDDEFSTGLTFTSNGLLAMANSGDDTNDSQFFITDVDETLAQLPQHLNFQHSIFGILTSGADVLRKIMATPVNSSTDKPLTNVVINSATVFTDTQNAVIRVHAANGFTGSTTLTILADDGHGNTDQKQATINVVTDTVNDRPFLGPVTNQTTNQGTPVTFTVQGIDLEKDQLTFVVKDASSFSTDTSTGTLNSQNVTAKIEVIPATGDTPALAKITLTPSANFSGTLNLIVGVRDATSRGASGTVLDSRVNFDTQKFTLTVNPVNRAPTTNGGTTSTGFQQSTTIQLTGNDGDPDKTQALTFELVGQPAHGTISNFNPATGALTYTPAAAFSGTDTFTYRVKDDGGTANGGHDTSTTATFTIKVLLPVPAGIALAALSDDGPFDDDRVTSDAAPTFTVNAEAGSTVRFLVNGSARVNSVETSAGHFAVTLSREMLRVGSNQVTAFTEVSGVASESSVPLEFTYAPSMDEIYTVPGSFGSSREVAFHWSSALSFFHGEIGAFRVDDLAGHIDGLAPGDAGYADAALARGQVLIARGAGKSDATTLNLHGGDLLAFYYIANETTPHFARHGAPAQLPEKTILFSIPEANAGGGDYLQTSGDPRTGEMSIRWLGGWTGWNSAFNTASLTVTPGQEPGAGGSEALRVNGDTERDVSITFTLDSSKQTAGGELGMFIVDDSSGAVDGISPTDPRYLQAVMSSIYRQTIFNPGDAVGTQKTITLPGGVLIGWYYIPGGTAADVVAANPDNNARGNPVALFSFDDANPAAVRSTPWFQANRGAMNLLPGRGGSAMQLHILDGLFSNARHLDDLLVGITGTI